VEGRWSKFKLSHYPKSENHPISPLHHITPFKYNHLTVTPSGNSPQIMIDFSDDTALEC